MSACGQLALLCPKVPASTTFLEFCFVWKYMDGHVEKLIYNFGHYSTAESFPWGRFFFPVWFAGRGLGWLWIKNIWIKFSRGGGGWGSSPRCKTCPWVKRGNIVSMDTPTSCLRYHHWHSAVEPTYMPTKK